LNDYWSEIEVDFIVKDYFNMLVDELSGRSINKADHRKKLQQALKNRSEGSIEFKHQNISAVLASIGRPFIKGYLPRYNYQKILEDKVIQYLIDNTRIEDLFNHFAEKILKVKPDLLDFNKLLVEAPLLTTVTEPKEIYKRKICKVNYLEKEQNNKRLGLLGEEIVIKFERWNLIKIGKVNLADSIEWISKDQGDGSGFDILSRYPNGKDKYIEVKSTKLSKETPFFFSSNELEFSIQHSDDFHLYRVYNLEGQVKIFIKKGNLNSICHSTPMSFKGYF
jgi:hypothetical protein